MRLAKMLAARTRGLAMKMRTPPDRPPSEPRRPARRSDTYLFAPTFALLIASAIVVAHTLFIR